MDSVDNRKEKWNRKESEWTSTLKTKVTHYIEPGIWRREMFEYNIENIPWMAYGPPLVGNNTHENRIMNCEIFIKTLQFS